jgi:nuclear pore complex protein Nup54
MSLFGGNNSSTGNKPGGLFALNTNTQQQSTPSLFGNTQQANTQNNNQSKPFSFGNTQAQTQPQTSIFGAPQQQQSQNIPPTKPGAFAFGLSQQQQDANLAPQRPPDQTLRFGNSTNQNKEQFAQSLWEEGRGLGVYRSVPAQMEAIKDKWDAASLASPLRTYVYKHVGDEREALNYRPSPFEDENKWEEALTKRPGPEWVPLIIRGFQEMGDKAKLQANAIANSNMLLHEINTSLEIQLESHNKNVAARLSECRRRQQVASRRTLALAVKVQILRNKGYVMDNAEEELKSRLEKLEREVCDPALDARQQEIWARMLGIRERAKRLKAGMERLAPAASADESILDEDTVKQAKEVRRAALTEICDADLTQILEAYDTQLRHLHKELQLVQQEYEDWEKFGRGNN